MRPEGSPDLNHSPKQTAIPDLKVLIPFPGGGFYEERTNWSHVPTETWPTRNIIGGTSENEQKERSDDFEEETRDPRSLTQPRYNWPAGRAMPHSSVGQVDSGSPSQISGSQFDTSNTSISPSQRREKRKRISESGEDEAANSKYKCRFCGQFFSKSQGLGGHMNRHREERENERVKHAYDLLEQADRRQSRIFQNPVSPLAQFRRRTPSSVPSQMTGMQTHQQSGFYYASPINWNPGASQNAPYASNPNTMQPNATMFNMPYVSSEGRNQDTMPGPSCETNPAEQQLFPSDPANETRVWPSLGAVGMQRNYLQTQPGASTSAVADRRFNPGFQSPSSYPLQFGAPGSDISGQGSESFQQCSFPSSIPAGFQLVSPSSSMPADFPEAPGTSVDVQRPPRMYPVPKSTPTIGPIPNEPGSGLPLVSDAMAIEGRMTGPPPSSPVTGLGHHTMEGESEQGSQRPGNNNNYEADSSSLSYGNDYIPVAEIESKYSQGLPKEDP